MLLGRGFPLFVIAALICVVAIFFHPAAAGSFVSTHGPVTSLRSHKLALTIFALLFACGTVIRELLALPTNAPQWLRSVKFNLAVPESSHDLSLHCSFLC